MSQSRKHTSNMKPTSEPLPEVWSQLQSVRSLRFEAVSAAATGWNGVGEGTVVVVELADDVIVFEETGTWQSQTGTQMQFNNTFRWSKLENAIRLEHLRFGPDQPVFLFDLAPDESDVWRDISPHQCREDCYSATLTTDGKMLTVAWSIQGPRKNETIRYVYW